MIYPVKSFCHTQVHVGKGSRMQVRLLEFRSFQDCLFESSSSKVGFLQGGLAQIRSAKVCVAEVRCTKHSILKISLRKIHSPEIRSREILLFEIRIPEIG